MHQIFVEQKMSRDFGTTWTCCAAGLQIHKYLRVLWGWSSCCCGEAHPAQRIRTGLDMRLDGKKKKQTKKTNKHSNNTWELHLWSQRLVDFLHQPREGATIHGLGQGVTCTHRLLEAERADHLRGKYFDFNSKLKTKKAKVHISLFINDLLSFGCEFLVSECLPKGRAINSQQLENNNTSVLGCASSQDLVHICTPRNTSRTVLTFARLLIWGSVVI